MAPFWRDSTWILAFALATACSGKSSDLFEDDGAGGEGAEEIGGFSNAGDDGAGGSDDRNTGGIGAVTGGVPGTGGSVAAGGTVAGGALGTGGVSVVGGTSSSGAGGAFGGAIGTGGTFGGALGTGGAVLGGKSSVGGSNSGSAGGGGASACVDPDGADYKKRSTAKGSNGTFEDRCDGGDLIEYVCETGYVPCLPMASSGAADTAAPLPAAPQAGSAGIALPPQCMAATGRVTETRVVCGGRCDEGACFGWCPGKGDELVYQDVAATEVVIDNEAKHARYRCEVTASTGDADCVDPALEGETREVDSLVSCSAASISFVARLAADRTCSYRCTLVD